MIGFESIAAPDGAKREIAELHRILALGAPALVGKNGTERIELPDVVYRILKGVVANMKAGKAIALIPEDAQLTTQAAANLLGVSRPHLIKLLETGEIDYAKTGSHRRVRLLDLRAYEKKRDQARRKALDELASEAMERGYYDGEIPEGGEDE